MTRVQKQKRAGKYPGTRVVSKTMHIGYSARFPYLLIIMIYMQQQLLLTFSLIDY